MSHTNNILLKACLPIIIGLLVVAWLFSKEFSIEQFRLIDFSAHAIMAIVLACLFVIGREWGMMWRFRVLTDRQLSWASALRVTMMCEFTSAITPTSAGGSALSMIFLTREGLSLGRSTTLTMVTLMLDELFMVIACPIIFILFPGAEIFGFDHTSAFATGVRIAFWCVYAGVCLITLLLYIGAFVKPHKIAAALKRLFRWRPLRRWQRSVAELGDNMIAAGADLRTRSFRWWSEAMAATATTWISRYLVVNALFWGLVATAPQTIVFARQFVVWLLLTVSPTPGGSGVSEWLFTGYYGDMVTDASIALIIAVIWRIISYYIYLIMGIAILPSWLRNKKTSAPNN